MLLLSVTFGVFGYLTRWPELIGMSAGLLFFLVLLAFGSSARCRGRLDLARLPQEVDFGKKLAALLELRFRGAHHWLRLTQGQILVKSKLQGGVSRVEIVLSTERRGRLAVGPFELQRVDPWGFRRRSLAVSDAQEVLVWPKTYPVDLLAAGVASSSDDVLGLVSVDGDTFATLREYQRGDDPRRIHWPTSSRLAKLVIRQSVMSPTTQLKVVLDADLTAYPANQALGDWFETGVSWAASLVKAAQEANWVTKVELVSGAGVSANQRRVNRYVDGMRSLSLIQKSMGSKREIADTTSGNALVVAEKLRVASSSHRLLKHLKPSTAPFLVKDGTDESVR